MLRGFKEGCCSFTWSWFNTKEESIELTAGEVQILISLNSEFVDDSQIKLKTSTRKVMIGFQKRDLGQLSPREKWDLKSWQLVSVTQNYQMLKILALLCVINLNWTNYEGILLIFKMWGNSPGSRYLKCHLDLKVKSRLKRGRMNCQI